LKNKRGNIIKVTVGILLSVLFLFLAFRKIEFTQMKSAFSDVNYWWLLPAILLTLVSHWIRSIRMQYFLSNLKKVRVSTLFSATMIGYMGNTVLPAHLGEIFRANVVGNREKISTSSVLATIVIERVVDMFSLLLIMVGALIFYPFPDLVKTGGYLMLIGTVGLALFLVLLKLQTEKTMSFLRFFIRILPKNLSERIEGTIVAFIDGINGLKRKRDYLYILIHTILIWGLYWATLHFVFFAFNLIEIYNMNTVSSVVVLVITAVSVVIPTSPGYVGAYHFFCQFSLALFGVPRPVGLSFGFVAHGISIIPTALIGFVLAWREGLNRLRIKRD